MVEICLSMLDEKSTHDDGITSRRVYSNIPWPRTYFGRGIPLRRKLWKKKLKLGAYAMKRVATSAHLPTLWLFEPAKRPDDRTDYWLDYLENYCYEVGPKLVPNGL